MIIGLTGAIEGSEAGDGPEARPGDSVRAGSGAPAGPIDTEIAIGADPRLSAAQKAALLAVLESFVAR